MFKAFNVIAVFMGLILVFARIRQMVDDDFKEEKEDDKLELTNNLPRDKNQKMVRFVLYLYAFWGIVVFISWVSPYIAW